MKTNNPLRRIGPRVFVSYSFQDKELAEKICLYLSGEGFQVRKEDETTLLGQNLKKVLPKRISDAEVIIHLLTTAANKSDWVRQEFDWAIKQKQQTESLLILPIVFDKNTIYERVKDWVYIDASSSGLCEDTLTLVARFCLNSVELLPLDENCIFHFSHDRIASLLSHKAQDKKRIIVDSDGILATLLEDIINVARNSNDPMANYFLQQEEKHQARVIHLLSIVDLIIPKLIEELRFYFQKYNLDFPSRAIEPVNRFTRYEIGLELLKIQDFLLPDQSNLLPKFIGQIEEAKNIVERAQSGNKEDCMFGKMYWVLGIRPSDNSQKWVQIKFGPKGDREGALMYLPQSGLGKDWQTILLMGEKPENLLYPYDWADFCIPQLATRAVATAVSGMYRSNFIDEAINAIGWRLSDYSQMGFH